MMVKWWHKLMRCNRVSAAVVAAVLLAVAPAARGEGGEPAWQTKSLGEQVVAPSPESSSLSGYVETGVDLSTGTGSRSVALAGWRTGRGGVEIGLSYRLGAIKSEAREGWCGLGWTLQGLGSVSRSIAGLPDELKGVRILDERVHPDTTKDLRYLEDYAEKRIDSSLDRYSYSYPGGGGSFVISGGRIVQLPMSDNRIEQTGTLRDGVRDFAVTTPDGTRYEYSEREHISYRYLSDRLSADPSGDYRAVDTWQLSRIILPEGRDTITLSYARMPEWKREDSRTTESVGVVESNNSLDLTGSGPSINGHTSTARQQTTFEDQCILKEISSRTGRLTVSHVSDPGNEGPGMFIGGMRLENSMGETVRLVSLEGGRKGSRGRRQLTRIRIESGDGELLSEERYEYYNDDGSPLGDLFGYNNHSHETVQPNGNVIDRMTGTFNARRRPDAGRMTSGALRRWHVSGGVSGEVEYEGSTAPYLKGGGRLKLRGPITEITPGDSLERPIRPFEPVEPVDKDTTVTIGLRIRRISERDVVSGREKIREYRYNDAVTDLELGELTASDFIGMSGGASHHWGAHGDEVSYSVNANLLEGSRIPGRDPGSATVFYGTVTELTSGTGEAAASRRDYIYDTERVRVRRVTAGHEDPGGVITLNDKRSLRADMLPAYCDPVSRRLLTGQVAVVSYYPEVMNGGAELREVVEWRHDGSGYTESSRTRYSYRTADSVSLSVATHWEPLVRRHDWTVPTRYDRDWRTDRDVNYYAVGLTAVRRLVDSVSVERRHEDGSRTVTGTRYLYTGLDRESIQLPGSAEPEIRYRGEKITEGDANAMESDLRYMNPDLRLPKGERTHRGGHVLEHRLVLSAEHASTQSRKARQRGIHTLPVHEQWIMDGTDTIGRSLDYEETGGRIDVREQRLGRGHTHLRVPQSGEEALMDRIVVHSYDRYGNPTEVESQRTGRVRYEWGYDGDCLVRSIVGEDGDGAATQTTEYEHRPLTGCTLIRRADGSEQRYSYRGGRLTEITDSEGRVLESYSYTLREARASYTSPTGTTLNTVRTSRRLTDDGDASESETIVDGYGAAIATVSLGFGGSGEDVAGVTRYDRYGRPTASWHAIGGIDVSAAIKSDSPLTDAFQRLYGTGLGAATYSYGGNTDGTARVETAAGAEYAGHPTTRTLQGSHPTDAARKVLRLRLEADGSISVSGIYGSGELECVREKDGDGGERLVFTDWQGREVLRRERTATGYADTYSISDIWGNVMAVVPPEASSRLGTGRRLGSAEADKWIYRQSYSRQLRPVEAMIPGGVTSRSHYDSRGRLAFVTDGRLAGRGQWMFTLYDPRGRVALTGVSSMGGNEEADETGRPVPEMTVRYTGPGRGLCGSGYEVTPELSAYLEGARILTANYYDDYREAAVAGGVHGVIPAGALSTPTGQCTLTRNAVLGPEADSIGRMLTEVMYYDRRSRLIGSAGETAVGGHLRQSLELSVGGLVKRESVSLERDTLGLGAETTMSYDRHGRIVDSRLTLRGSGQGATAGTAPATTPTTGAAGVEVWRTESDYDSQGRLWRQRQGIGGIERQNEYDLAGRLRKWSMPFISEQLWRGDGGQTPSYTGRISAKERETMEGVKADGSVIAVAGGRPLQRGVLSRWRYDYAYDPLGRLTAATYSDAVTGGITLPDGSKADYSTEYSYDLQGNMKTLRRQGLTAPGRYGAVDDVTMTYDGNRLTGLSESAADVLLETSPDTPEGDWGEESFGYDANGNLTRDLSRGIEQITYNVLNLPGRIEFSDGSLIEYEYLADGTRLGERVTDAGGTEVSHREYAGRFVFEGGEPVGLETEDGYVTLADTTMHVRVADYQGNTVAVWNGRTLQIEQQTDYYPYGMPLSRRPLVPPAPIDITAYGENRRLYGGKELTTRFGLNAMDFHARQLSMLGRFDRPDPLAWKYCSLSPYLYCAGDPINFVDPTGKDVELYFTQLPYNAEVKESIEKLANKLSKFGLDNIVYNYASKPTHSFLRVTTGDKEVYAAYGEVNGSDKLVRVSIPQDKEVYSGEDDAALKKCFVIDVPSQYDGDAKAFEEKVIEVINDFGNVDGITYCLYPYDDTKGNCNSSTYTILLKAGVPEEYLDQIYQNTPGITWGFGMLRPWTKEEQEEAVNKK